MQKTGILAHWVKRSGRQRAGRLEIAKAMIVFKEGGPAIASR
jgi:hypothetical protein